MQKQWNPDLWKPLGIKPVDVPKSHERKTNSFLDYQVPDDRYEVRGIMPKAPKNCNDEVKGW